MPTNKFIIKMDPTDLVPKSSARIYYYLAFWFIVVQVLTILLLWRHLPTIVPLYFTVPWGEARLASKFSLMFLPGLSLAALVTNLLLGKSAKDISPVLVYTLAVASLVVVLMFSLALGGILQSIV